MEGYEEGWAAELELESIGQVRFVIVIVEIGRLATGSVTVGF